jgi:hypothetical protein
MRHVTADDGSTASISAVNAVNNSHHSIIPTF